MGSNANENAIGRIGLGLHSSRTVSDWALSTRPNVQKTTIIADYCQGASKLDKLRAVNIRYNVTISHGAC